MSRAPLSSLLACCVFWASGCGGGGRADPPIRDTRTDPDVTFPEDALELAEIEEVDDIVEVDDVTEVDDVVEVDDLAEVDDVAEVEDVMDVEEEEVEEVSYVLKLVDSQRIGSTVLLFVSVTTEDGVAVTGLAPGDFTVEEDGAALSTVHDLDISLWTSDIVWRTLLLHNTSYAIVSGGELAGVMTPAWTHAASIVALDTRSRRVSIAAYDGAATPRPVLAASDTGELLFTPLANKLSCSMDAFLASECTVHGDCTAIDSTRPECISGLCMDRSTNLYGSVIWGIDRVEEAVGAETRVGYPRGGSLIVYADDDDRAGRRTLTDVTSALARTRVTVFAVGRTGGLDATVREAVGRDGEWDIAALTDLPTVLGLVGSRIEAIRDGIYAVSYCTLVRDGTISVTVEVDHAPGIIDLDFSIPAVAACELDLSTTACTGLACGAGTQDFYCGDCAGAQVCDESSVGDTGVGICESACTTTRCGRFTPEDAGEPVDCGCCGSDELCTGDHECVIDICSCPLGTFDVTPTPGQTCDSVAYSLSAIDITYTSPSTITVTGTPFSLVDPSYPCTGTFVAAGTGFFSGCLDATLSGEFADCDHFTGTWTTTHDPTVCSACSDYSVAVTGTKP